MSHGSERRARTDHLTVRLTPEERAAIDEMADRAGLAAGSYVRQAVFGAPRPRQVRRPPVERRELARLLGQLGHIGGNLNQIAKAANSGDGIDRIDLSEAVAGLAVVRDAILQALGRDL
ncbi:MAG TPA: plasmid mobilization relaxosome protein MobC [Acetobacteraceae bacterium]|nr:plasmid mobilization relaxosome protein MobC [Acetobacteraceae bacterium]